VHEGPEAGAEARAAVEVAREGGPRALMEISSEREDVASTYTLILAEQARRALEQELRNPEGPRMHQCFIMGYDQGAWVAGLA
jgi:predicted esterase